MYNNNQWTDSRFRSFIKSALRSASSKWPPKYQALNDACIGTKTNKKTGRLAKHYKCANCNNDFPAKEIQVDHIDPVIDPIKGFTTWDEVVKRMFCEKIGFQILCIPCHKVKTNQEKQITKERKINDPKK
jgi:5-methylcytosine-specific restriction endonuclease McrA